MVVQLRGEQAAPSAALDGNPQSSITADIIAVFVFTMSSVGFTISFAVLVFGGAAEAGMSRAIGSFVIGGGVMAVVVGLRSQIVPVATFVQGSPAIVMAGVLTDFVARDGVEMADVFVLLAVTMAATSLVAGLLGHFGLGELGRALPTPVVGAFVGGTGWLLLKGGFNVMTNSTIGLVDVGGLFNFEVAKFWLPGLVIGLIAWLAGRSMRVPGYAVGLIVGASLAGFYVLVALASSVAAVESGGWLLGPFPETEGTRLVTPDEFRTANWSSIAKTIPGIASVVALTCVAQLLNLTGIRSELVPRLNVDAELRVGAGANLAAALFGVTPGFQGFGYTVLLDRLGATRQAVPLISGGLVVVFGVVGVAAVGYIPRLIVGAMLVMIGVALLDDWIRGLMRLTSVAEQLLGVAIVGAVAWLGLLQGIGLGLVAAGVGFVVRYSRIDPVRSVNDAGQLSDRLVVVELQGYLFFGSLATLEDRVRTLTLGPSVIETLVLDFANVTGVDSSGGATIARLLHELESQGIAIDVSALSPELSKALLTCAPELKARVTFSPSIDSALRSRQEGPPAIGQPRQQQHTRNRIQPSQQLVAECSAHRFEPNSVILAKNTPSEGLFIVQSGRAVEFQLDPEGIRTSLRNFGKLSVISGAPRTTEIVAGDVVKGWWLSIDHYRYLQDAKPWLILELHEFIAQRQVERLKARQTTSTITTVTTMQVPRIGLQPSPSIGRTEGSGLRTAS